MLYLKLYLQQCVVVTGDDTTRANVKKYNK